MWLREPNINVDTNIHSSELRFINGISNIFACFSRSQTKSCAVTPEWESEPLTPSNIYKLMPHQIGRKECSKRI